MAVIVTQALRYSLRHGTWSTTTKSDKAAAPVRGADIFLEGFGRRHQGLGLTRSRACRACSTSTTRPDRWPNGDGSVLQVKVGMIWRRGVLTGDRGRYVDYHVFQAVSAALYARRRNQDAGSISLMSATAP